MHKRFEAVAGVEQLISIRMVAAVSAVLTGSVCALLCAQQTPANTRRASPSVLVRQAEEGAILFGNYCGRCHGNPKEESAPPPAMLRRMTPERIYQALTTGDMVTLAKDLSDEQKIYIAEWVGGRKLGSSASGDGRNMINGCPADKRGRQTVSNPLLNSPAWNGWSDDANTRFQPASAAKLPATSVARLRLKWAFGVPSAASVYGQPTVVGGIVYFSSDAAWVYALDAASGCVRWSFQAQSGVRSAIVIGPSSPNAKQSAFFGDIHGNVYSLDAISGRLLWRHSVDAHPLTRITAGVRIHKGRVYVPVASLEEPESFSPNYRCCTFRGMVVALDAKTGEQVWKTWTIDEAPSERKTADGTSFLGPSGAGVWGPLTIDPKRNALYLGTGNNFSAPDMGRSDALIALDLDTGKIIWVHQDEAGDVWHNGCPQGNPPTGFPPKNAGTARKPGVDQQAARPVSIAHAKVPEGFYCPSETENPDWDFAAGAMLINLPGGRRLLLAGQKSGLVWAHDPDRMGAPVWRADISRGQIVFGGATDGQTAYFVFKGGGLAALSVADGREKWYVAIPPQPSMHMHPGLTAAVTLIPGIVFTGGLDGMIRAFRTSDGKAVWEFDTARDIETVNGVEGSGGSIGAAGVTVAGGMVFAPSGYTGFQGGQPGNLLLAFAP